MSTVLKTVLTQAGLAAVMAADDTHLKAKISHIAIGDGGYTPAATATSLRSEKARVSIASGKRQTPTQWHLTALFDIGANFWVKELGVFLDDGTLLAVWSSASQPLAYKTADTDLIVAFDLPIAELPADALEVTATAPDTSLTFAEELAAIASVQIDQMNLHLQTELRLRDAGI